MIASAIRDLGNPCEAASLAAYQAVTQHLQSQSQKWRDIADRLPTHLRSNRVTATIGMMDSDIIFQALVAMRQATKMIAAKGSSWSDVLGLSKARRASPKASPETPPKRSNKSSSYNSSSWSYTDFDSFEDIDLGEEDGDWNPYEHAPGYKHEPHYEYTKDNIEERLRRSSEEWDRRQAEARNQKRSEDLWSASWHIDEPRYKQTNEYFDGVMRRFCAERDRLQAEAAKEKDRLAKEVESLAKQRAEDKEARKRNAAKKAAAKQQEEFNATLARLSPQEKFKQKMIREYLNMRHERIMAERNLKQPASLKYGNYKGGRSSGICSRTDGAKAHFTHGKITIDRQEYKNDELTVWFTLFHYGNPSGQFKTSHPEWSRMVIYQHDCDHRLVVYMPNKAEPGYNEIESMEQRITNKSFSM